MTVPSNLVPTRVSQLPEYSGSSTEGYSLYIVDGVTYKYQLKYAFGSVTSVAASGGSTGMSFGGSPIIDSGTLTLNGTLNAAHGGTGQTIFSDGELLIGKTDGTLAKATLTAGTGMVITNGDGEITLSSPATGTVMSVNASGGTTGFSFSGGPITDSGTLTLSGTLIPASGGTGLTSFTVGDIVYASGSTTLAKLADIATGNVLLSGGVGTAPSYGKVGLSTHVSGTLPVGSGGTGITSYTAGDLVYASASNLLAKLPDVASGNVLLSGGVGLSPAYGKVGLTTHVSGTLPVANGGTSFASYSSGQVLIGKADGSLAKTTLTAGSGISITNGDGAISIAATVGGGTVTSVDASGGTTGLSFSGGPITDSGTLTLSGTLAAANGGTGQSTYSNGQLLIGKTDGSLAKATLTAGTGISVTNGDGTISVAATNNGTVTSVDASGGTTGLSFSGGPITDSGTLTLSGTLAVANGGTGMSSYTVGDLIYASGATGLSKLADVATGNVLISGGVNTAPAYGKVGLTTHVSGTLPVANGGTNITSYTKGDIVYASGTTTLTSLADVATGNVLLSGGVGADPAYGKVGLTTHVSGILPAANGGTENGFFAVSGPATSAKTFTFPNASATVLTTNAAVTVAQGGTGIASGTSGGIPYFSGSTTIASSGALAANEIVLGGGAGATPATLGSKGTTTTVLHGNASGAPTFGAVSLTADVSGTLPVANGGTGQTSYTDGQLLIGNSSGNTLTKATLTAGTNVTITNGNGSITIAASGGGASVSVGTSAPVSPSAGDLWWDSTYGNLYLYYNDGNTSQWVSAVNGATGATGPAGPTNLTENSQSAAYTLVLGDAGGLIFHPASDANARTFTIPANASVAYPLGTTVTFANYSTNNVTIAINSDTLRLGGAGTTGSRTLAQYGVATALKVGSTDWVISGVGLT